MILAAATALKQIDAFLIICTTQTVTELAEQYRQLIEAARQDDDRDVPQSIAFMVDVYGSLKFPNVWLDVRDAAFVEQSEAA